MPTNKPYCRPRLIKCDQSTSCLSDIPECTASPSPCNQSCAEQPGSFTCSCDQLGFKLDADQSSCIGEPCNLNICLCRPQYKYKLSDRNLIQMVTFVGVEHVILLLGVSFRFTKDLNINMIMVKCVFLYTHNYMQSFAVFFW